MKIELESDSATAGSARRASSRRRRSASAKKKAATKTTPARKTAAQKAPAKKPVKIPNSIQVLVQRAKPKLRVSYSEPGRYILTGRSGMLAVVRVKEETRYTPSVGTKMFQRKALESKSSSLDELFFIGAGAYSEPEDALEAEYRQGLESESAAPGARSTQAGQKMGRKKRAPNMLAPGWHVFKKSKEGKITREYVGPRMSARRLLDIAQGTGNTKDTKAPSKKAPAKAAPASKKAGSMQKRIDTKTRQVERIKARMEKATDKTKKKELAGKARELNAEIRGLTRDMKKENTAAKRDAKKAERAAAKPQKAAELDRKVASDLRKDLTDRGLEGAKVQRSTKDGSMKITIDKGDRTKLTGALNGLKKKIEGKLEIVRKMVGDKVVATVKLSKAPKGRGKSTKAKEPAERKPSASTKEGRRSPYKKSKAGPLNLTDLKKRLISEFPNAKAVGRVANDKYGDRKTVGIVSGKHSVHSQNVYETNGKYVVAQKYVGTSPWTYLAYKDKKTMEAGGDDFIAYIDRADNKQIDNFVDALKS